MFSHIGNWFSWGFSVQPMVYRHAEGQELHQKLPVDWAEQDCEQLSWMQRCRATRDVPGKG